MGRVPVERELDISQEHRQRPAAEAAGCTLKRAPHLRGFVATLQRAAANFSSPYHHHHVSPHADHSFEIARAVRTTPAISSCWCLAGPTRVFGIDMLIAARTSPSPIMIGAPKHWPSTVVSSQSSA